MWLSIRLCGIEKRASTVPDSTPSSLHSPRIPVKVPRIFTTATRYEGLLGFQSSPPVKAAYHENVEAHYNLGLLYEYGRGVPRDRQHVHFTLTAQKSPSGLSSPAPMYVDTLLIS